MYASMYACMNAVCGCVGGWVWVFAVHACMCTIEDYGSHGKPHPFLWRNLDF